MGNRKAARKTPREKKQLSYAKDRRNNYGENDKSSRKNIRRRKKLVNRANRHRDTQVLGDVAGFADSTRADTVEQALLARRRKRWRKSADAPLGTHVEGSLVGRQRLAAAQSRRIEASLRRLRRNRQARRAAGDPGFDLGACARVLLVDELPCVALL